MAKRPLLPLADYQRIYQVAYSVLEASDVAITHRACLFFATVGVLILREHYRLPATISAGCMAMMVNEAGSNVLLYGREENGTFVSDTDAFHAWVECDGWLVDFMAPIMGVSLRADGHKWPVPRRMLQKRLEDRQAGPGHIQRLGEFYARHDAALTEALIDKQSVMFSDLTRIALAWFRRPPKPLNDVGMADTRGATKRLVARAPSIDGAW